MTEILGACDPNDVQILTAWLSGELVQGRIGLGPALLREVAAEAAADTPSLELTEVNRAMEELASISGKGSLQRRRELLAGLMRRATRQEQQFLLRLWMGELRQGALEGVMVEAIAAAAGIDVAAVRRAVMLSGDIAAVAAAVLGDGESGLSRFRLQVGTPVNPMLAQPSDNIGDALASLGEAAIEFKIDGARVQVHRSRDDVHIYSRQRNEVSERLPEIVEAVHVLKADSFILDGEVVALREDGRPHPFQVTMRRFGRRLAVSGARAELPLSVFFFDCLLADGEDLTGLPTRRRFAALHELLPDDLVIPRVLTADEDIAASFMQRALAEGHEGVMAKSLEAVYEAGNRGANWLKIKPVHTLDLVVLAAEWGSGRRRGRLSNLHLGARDPAGGFVMLGKTFKGLTDEMLAWQTEKLLQLEERREDYIVYVRPELVVEIAFNELQRSRQYPGGLALRFARVRRYREDKSAADADTIETVRAIHERRR